jgi:hypothetical protein
MLIFSPQEILSWNKEFDLFTDSSQPDPELIRQSLYPPLPVKKNRLIWGFNIVKVSLQYKIKQLICKDVSTLDLPQSLALALRLENRTEGYSWQEKENIYRLLNEVENNRQLDQIIFLIQGRKDNYFLSTMQEYTGLKHLQKKIITHNILDFKFIRHFQQLPLKYFQFLWQNRQKYTHSQRRIVTCYVAEIYFHKKLTTKQLEKLLFRINSEKDPINTLKAERFPQLTKMKRRFEQIKDNILKHTGIQLESPSDFEGDSFTVSFKFNSIKNLDKKIKALEKLKQQAYELFKLLQ